MNQRTRNIIIHIICSLAVMAAAVLVRLPSVYLTGTSEVEYESFTREDGMPYLQEMDSYYHVRLVDNLVQNGSLGNTTLEDGTPWDSLRYAPEGKDVNYPPGIMWITVIVWKILNALFGTGLYTVEFYLSAGMAALTALAAYIIGYRLSGKAGGFVSGVVVSCTSGFVMRTCIGRYDTDMIVILMDVLLVLCMTETMRAKKPGYRILFSLLFGISAWLYSVCWTADGSVLFIGLILVSGLIYIITMYLVDRFKKQTNEKEKQIIEAEEEKDSNRKEVSKGTESKEKGTSTSAELTEKEAVADKHKNKTLLSSNSIIWIIAAVTSFVLILITYGPSFIKATFTAFLSSIELTKGGELPNVYASISELQKPAFAPDSFSQLFSGYVQGGEVYIVNGVGGLMIFALSVVSLVWLSLHCFQFFRRDNELILSSKECAIYAIIMGLLFFGGLYATERGARFVEHLAVPVGILGGSFIGWIAVGMNKEKVKVEAFKILFSIVLCVVSIIPVIKGSIDYCKETRPSVTDAEQQAMQWIKENSETEDAVIVSWWDMGYYFESETGHPCFWDGGSSTGIRTMLISKALTSDPELSKKIFYMVASSGDKPVEILMEHTDTKNAFETLWNALVLDKDEAIKEIQKCDFSEAEAEELEQMIHPEEKKEMYLVLESDMMYVLGWYEYFADWDFKGEKPPLKSSSYLKTPDGYSIEESEEGKKYMKEVRSKELIWRLMGEGEQLDGYVCEFGKDDNLEQVMVWRIY